MRRALSVAWAAVVLSLLPSVASACPACARGKLGPAALVAIGSMILLPFAIAAVVVPIVRRGAGPQN